MAAVTGRDVMKLFFYSGLLYCAVALAAAIALIAGISVPTYVVTLVLAVSGISALLLCFRWARIFGSADSLPLVFTGAIFSLVGAATSVVMFWLPAAWIILVATALFLGTIGGFFIHASRWKWILKYRRASV